MQSSAHTDTDTCLQADNGEGGVRRNLRNINNINVPRRPQNTKIFLESTIFPTRPFNEEHSLCHHALVLNHKICRRMGSVSFWSAFLGLFFAAVEILALARGGRLARRPSWLWRGFGGGGRELLSFGGGGDPSAGGGL